MGTSDMHTMASGATSAAQDERLVRTLFEQARKRSDRASLGALLEYYRPLLERLSSRRVSRRLATKVSSSEVTQITLANAAERFEDFRGETVEQFRAWLCAILQNEITDHSRRFLTSQCRAMARETSLRRDIAEEPGRRPSQICSANEQVAKLLEAVDCLPDELREIVRMRYQQNMTFAEIANSLGLPAATARRRWLQAVEQIEQMML
ncbi:MAG: sigma-70 family RNA polymerase sigma factor [Aureliella sp.]